MKTRIIGIAVAILFISVAFTGAVSADVVYTENQTNTKHYDGVKSNTTNSDLGSEYYPHRSVYPRHYSDYIVVEKSNGADIYDLEGNLEHQLRPSNSNIDTVMKIKNGVVYMTDNDYDIYAYDLKQNKKLFEYTASSSNVGNSLSNNIALDQVNNELIITSNGGSNNYYKFNYYDTSSNTLTHKDSTGFINNYYGGGDLKYIDSEDRYFSINNDFMFNIEVSSGTISIKDQNSGSYKGYSQFIESDGSKVEINVENSSHIGQYEYDFSTNTLSSYNNKHVISSSSDVGNLVYDEESYYYNYLKTSLSEPNTFQLVRYNISSDKVVHNTTYDISWDNSHFSNSDGHYMQSDQIIPISDGEVNYYYRSLYFDNGNFLGEKYYIDTLKQATLDDLKTSISGNDSSYNSYGSDSMFLNSTATFSDGSTKDVNSSTTYSGYDSNIVQQVGSTNEFTGVGVGTTTIDTSYTDSNGNTVTDSITVTVNKPVTNAQVLLTGSDDAVFNGTEQETYATEITYYNGTTEYADDADLTYSYDSSIIINVSDVYTNLETFEGEDNGTTIINSTYTGFDGAKTSTGDTTITVNNPPKITSVEFVNATTNNEINGSITLEQGESYAIKQKTNYDDGSSTYSTSNLGTSNSTEVSLSGNTYTANIYGVDGHTHGYGTWSQSWFSTSGLTTFDINIVAEPESVNLILANDEIKQGEETSYTVDTTYENGTVIDETPKATMAYNGTKEGGGVTFDNQNGTINATGFGTIKITSTINPSDSEVLVVEPSVKWDNYDNLNNQERLILSFSDLEFLALFIAAIIGVALVSKVNMVAGIAGFAMTVFLSWAVGIMSIYMPILMTIFMAFIGFGYQFMNLSNSGMSTN